MIVSGTVSETVCTINYQLCKSTLSVNVSVYSPHQAAKLEESRRTSSVVVESGCVSMGTGAPLPPQVLVVVDGMQIIITVSCLVTRQRFNEVHLILENNKPPVIWGKNDYGKSKRS